MSNATRASLAIWHEAVAGRDIAKLSSILHPDAVFRSPMAHTPYKSAPALMLILGAVIQVFEDFTYHRTLVTDDGLSVVLEFSARIGKRELKGIDLLRFDADGKLVELEVMIRPASGLQALGEEMGKRLGHLLPGYKSP